MFNMVYNLSEMDSSQKCQLGLRLQLSCSNRTTGLFWPHLPYYTFLFVSLFLSSILPRRSLDRHSKEVCFQEDVVDTLERSLAENGRGHHNMVLSLTILEEAGVRWWHKGQDTEVFLIRAQE